MNELVTTMKGNVVVSSLDVAKHFHKRHDNLLKIVEKAESTALNFKVSGKPFMKTTYSDR